MRRTTGGWIVLGALVAFGATDIVAQDAVQEPVREGPRVRALPVEAVMRMRDRLELTEEQVAELDVIRREIVEERSTERAALAEMRSRLAAGQIRRSELMAFMEERQDATEGVTDQRRARVEGVLTEAQLETLQELRVRADAFARGRASVRGGERDGFRGRPGMRGGRRPWAGPRFRRDRSGVRAGPFGSAFEDSEPG